MRKEHAMAKKKSGVAQTPFQTLGVDLMRNPEMPSIRALAFRTRYGAFLFALDREQMETVEKMLRKSIEGMPTLS